MTQDTTRESDKNTTKHHKREPRGQPSHGIYRFTCSQHKFRITKLAEDYIWWMTKYLDDKAEFL